MRSLILAAALPLWAAPPSAELLGKHLEAIGSRAAAAQLTTLVRKAVAEFPPSPTSYPVEVYAKATGQWQFVLTIPRTFIMEQVSDGKTAWRQNLEGATELRPQERARSELAFNFSILLRPQEHFSFLTVKGQETSRGRQVWVVEAKQGEGEPLLAHFDIETGLLTRLGSILFEDYRDAGGVKVPYTIGVVEGKFEQRIRTTELRPNVPLENARFQKEASAAVYRLAMERMTREALDHSLKGLEAGSARAALEDLHNFDPQDGRILYDLIADKGYQRGLEIGTAEGNSAIWMGMAFRKNGGRLLTLEIDSGRAQAATANFAKAGLEGVIECRNSDALKEIPALEGAFDFVFMDTGTALHHKLLELVYPRVAPGGAIASHNSNDFERLMPDFLKAITTNPNLDTKIIPTPGGGISVSIKKDQGP